MKHLWSFAICLVVGAYWAPGRATAGDLPPAVEGDVTLADLLPAETLLFFHRPDAQAQDAGYQKSVYPGIAENPEMRQFLEMLEGSRRQYVQEVATHANLDPALVNSLLQGRLSGGIVDVAVSESPEGKSEIAYTLVLAVHLDQVPEQKQIFDAIKAMVARWQQQSAQGAKLPLKQVAWQENYPGGHTVMMIAGANPLRFVLLGKNLIFYRGPKSEGLKEILGNSDNPLTAKTLSKTPLYLAVRQGAETQPGMGFLYVNTTQFYSLLGAVRMPRVTRLMEVLGINGVQALGCAGGFYEKGMRHTLYLHAPRERRGLIKSLSMKPKAEEAAVVLPKDAPGILAARADLATLYQEIPLLVDAVEQALSRPAPVGLATLAGQQTILGVPAQEVLATLGDAVIVEPGPAGWALRFDNARGQEFEAAIGRMEKTLKKDFAACQVTDARGQSCVIRYFNRSDQPLPVAPSYAILQKRENGTAVVYIASYPQVLKSILRHRAAGSLQDAPDYQQVMLGMGKGYGVFIYVDNASGYSRVFDRVFLPALNAWRSASAAAPDPGLLPPGQDIANHFFGCGVGIKNSPDGITFTAYSPMGLGGFAVFLLDKFVVSNPTAIGMLGAEIARYLGAEETRAPELDAGEGPDLPAPADPRQKLPGIGGN